MNCFGLLQDQDRLLQDIKQQQTVEGLHPSELLIAEKNQLQQERDLLREEPHNQISITAV